MGVMMGPAYSDGVRISPNEYHLPKMHLDGEVSYNANKQGAELRMGVDEEGVLNIKSIAGNDSFGGWHPKRNISLKAESGVLKEVDIMSKTQGDIRGHIIHLNLEGDYFDPEEGKKTSIMFQENGERKFGERGSKIVDEKGRNWSILQPNDFKKTDISSAITKAVEDVEVLLKDVNFVNHPNIAQDIIKMLTGFGDDSLHILSMFEKNNAK